MNITLPEAAAWDAIVSAGKGIFRDAPAVDSTDWTAIVALQPGAASEPARFYITAPLAAPEAATRRALTLADAIAAAGAVVTATKPHPFQVGNAKTDSVVDYRTLVTAAAAAAAAVAAAAAAKRLPANCKFKDASVIRRIAAARQFAAAAGHWHYDDSLRPAAMTDAAAAALDVAMVCALVQQGATGGARDAHTENALYGAVALLAALTAQGQPAAAPGLHSWAAATARALRVEAAAELRDPRPPAATMKATDAQILLEASSATLSSKAASRLRLAVALNGYISANESPATIAAAAAPPQLNTLFKHILEPAAAAIAAKWPPPTTDRDDISPYRPFMVIRA